MCGGAYGRRKRSARRNLMKKIRNRNKRNIAQDNLSFNEGIDNVAFENGRLNLIKF